MFEYSGWTCTWWWSSRKSFLSWNFGCLDNLVVINLSMLQDCQSGILTVGWFIVLEPNIWQKFHGNHQIVVEMFRLSSWATSSVKPNKQNNSKTDQNFMLGGWIVIDQFCSVTGALWGSMWRLLDCNTAPPCSPRLPNGTTVLCKCSFWLTDIQIHTFCLLFILYSFIYPVKSFQQSSS